MFSSNVGKMLGKCQTTMRTHSRVQFLGLGKLKHQNLCNGSLGTSLSQVLPKEIHIFSNSRTLGPGL
jgi:hypothetical protein